MPAIRSCQTLSLYTVGCHAWNTNCRITFGEPLIWRPSLECFPSSWRMNRWVLLWPALQLYETMMQISDEHLSGSPEKETALLRDKLGPLQFSESNFSGSMLNSITLPCSLECSLTCCDLCSNSSLKLQQNLDLPCSHSAKLSFLVGFAWGLLLCHSMHQLKISDLPSAEVVQEKMLHPNGWNLLLC